MNNRKTKFEFLKKILNESKTESCLIPDLLAENYDSQTMQNYQPILSINHNYEKQVNNNCHKKYNEKYPKFTVYYPNNRTISIDTKTNLFNQDEKFRTIKCQVFSLEHEFDDSSPFVFRNGCTAYDLCKNGTF